VDSTEMFDRLACAFCGEETKYRFCSWRCTVQGVGAELTVEMNEDPALVPVRAQSRDGWVLDGAKDFDVYDVWLNGTVADDVMASLIQDTVGKRPADIALYRSRQGGRERRGLERISETWTMDAEVVHYIAVDDDYLIQEAPAPTFGSSAGTFGGLNRNVHARSSWSPCSARAAVADRCYELRRSRS
jgi:hypothetical protein